jgi:hypothetical protein
MGTKNKVLSTVGKKGSISVGGFRVEVEVIDYKNSYGRDRYLVSPVAGSGEIWTEQNPLA